ncbi:MAG: sugar transferase [Calditrichaceae bacterium]|nr:sugar transferase [Calditrichaceae bacterium]MBN2707496.1 sugar transferase [Calditrichaceae bacterium]RQV95587.1 MAG: sugar transferase [Calditrichota bacterium]
MIAGKYRFFKNLALTLDIFAGLIAFYIGFVVKEFFLPYDIRGVNVTDEFWITLIISVIVFYFWSQRFNIYDSLNYKNFKNITLNTFYIITSSGLTLFTFFFIFRFQSISRIFISLYLVLSFFLIILSRLLMQYILRENRRQGVLKRNIIIVGTGEQAKEFISILQNHEFWRMNIVGLLDINEKFVGEMKHGFKIIGTIKELKQILLNQPIDEVVYAVSIDRMNNLKEVLDTCEEVGVTTRVTSNFFNMMISKTRIEHLNGLPILTYSPIPDFYASLIIKRVIDILLSIIVLIVFSPFFLIIAILIKLGSPGPLLFVQKRLGLNGRQFKMYKLRTMVENAETIKEEFQFKNEMSGPVFKIKKDPRITGIGSFLRKTSLDEFPQFVNVLRGEMSIVGPRPPVPQEVKNYEPWQRRRLSMRPGLTCLWQISGRSHISFDEWMKLDLKYIDNWSLWLDFKIIFKTIPVVLLGKGAY